MRPLWYRLYHENQLTILVYSFPDEESTGLPGRYDVAEPRPGHVLDGSHEDRRRAVCRGSTVVIT